MGMIDLDVLTLDEPIKRIIEVCKYKILQVEDAIFLVDENQVIFSSLASFVTDRSPVRTSEIEAIAETRILIKRVIGATLLESRIRLCIH